MESYPNPRRYRAIFLLCFIGIAVIEIVSSLVNDRVTAHQQQIIRFTQLGERQQTLSLKIALLAIEYVETTDADVQSAKRKAIASAAAEFRIYYNRMLKSDRKLGYSVPGVPSVDQILFGEPLQLDREIRRFLTGVDEVVDRSWAPDLAGKPFMADINAAATGSMSTGLNRLNQAMRDVFDDEVGTLRFVQLAISACVVATIIGLTLLVVLPLLRRLTRQTNDLIDLAQTDPLTGCHNRRSFMQEAEAEFDRFRRYRNRFAVIMLDIDRFKLVNDTYGHAAGDEVIRTLVRVCLESTRTSDTLGRIGGEEFSILLPEASPDNARLTAEKLRAAIEATPVDYHGQTIRYTASLGVTVANEADTELFDVINRADSALYDAKHDGRNRVSIKEAAPVDA